MSQLGAVIGIDRIETSATVPVVDPSTGRVFAETADCGPEEIDRAVRAAQEAGESWKRRSVADRAARSAASARWCCASSTRWGASSRSRQGSP